MDALSAHHQPGHHPVISLSDLDSPITTPLPATATAGTIHLLTKTDSHFTATDETGSSGSGSRKFRNHHSTGSTEPEDVSKTSSPEYGHFKTSDYTIAVTEQRSNGVFEDGESSQLGEIVAGPNGEGGLQYKVYRRRWIGLIVLALLNVITSWGWLSFAASADLAAQLFGFETTSRINWLSTVILLAYVVASPFVTWILIKRSVKPAMIVCAVLCVVGNWLRYAGIVKRIYGLVMVGQILIGIAQPFALSSTGYYTDMWFTSRSRISANAISTIANPLGGAIAQLVGPAIVVVPEDFKTFILITAVIASAFGALVLIVPAHPPLPPCPSAAFEKLPVRTSLSLLVRNRVYLALLAMFSVYVALFNTYTTYILQIMQPYGYTNIQAGIAGAILIIVGLLCCAVTSPILDRTHSFILVIKIALPLMAGCYIALNFTSTFSQQLIGPYLVSAVLGAISFSILPVLLEWVQEQTSPVTPALPSTILWGGGCLLGGILIIAMDALKYGPDQGSPPGNMKRALILQTVMACVGVLPAYFIRDASVNHRIVADEAHFRQTTAAQTQSEAEVNQAAT